MPTTASGFQIPYLDYSAGKANFKASSIRKPQNPFAMEMKKFYSAPVLREWEVCYDLGFLTSAKSNIDDWYEDVNDLTF